MTDMEPFQNQLKVGDRVRVLATLDEGFILSTSFAWDGPDMTTPSMSYVLAGDSFDDEEYYSRELEVIEPVSVTTVTELELYLDEINEEDEDPADAENEEDYAGDEDEDAPASRAAFEAWLALRGLRTLGVRLDRAETNAEELARRLRAAGHSVRTSHRDLTR